MNVFLTLVMLLGSNDFRVRERAHATLRKCGELALPALLLGERDIDPEIRERCKQLTARYYHDHADAILEKIKKDFGLKAWPWLQPIGGSDGGLLPFDIYSNYVELAKDKGFTNEAPEYLATVEATRMLLRDRVAARWPITEIVVELITRQKNNPNAPDIEETVIDE
jgi:hypothetical protein